MGVRAYGWAEDGVTVVPVEADVLRSAARDVIAGKSMRSIVAELNERGIPTASGAKWQITPLRRILTNPRMVGRRMGESGRFVGRQNREPILPADTFRKVRAVLTNPDRAASAPKRNEPALLSSTARCGLCGQPLRASAPSGRKPRYACRDNPGCGRIEVQVFALEEHVARAVVTRLVEHGAKIAERVAWWGSVNGAHERVRELEARRAAISRDYARGAITAEMAAEASASLDARRAEVEAAEWTDTIEVEPITEVSIASWWVSASAVQRRKLVELLVEAVKVFPSKRTGHGGMDPDRFRIVWHEGGVPVEGVARLWSGV